MDYGMRIHIYPHAMVHCGVNVSLFIIFRSFLEVSENTKHNSFIPMQLSMLASYFYSTLEIPKIKENVYSHAMVICAQTNRSFWPPHLGGMVRFKNSDPPPARARTCPHVPSAAAPSEIATVDRVRKLGYRAPGQDYGTYVPQTPSNYNFT